MRPALALLPFEAMQNSFRFTKENAREMGRRGGIARKRYVQLALERQTAERLAIERAAENPLPPEQYLQTRIARIRAQLDRLDEMLLDETDPQKLSWLATCTAKLSEQERILAGRPNPGHLRPSAPRRNGGVRPMVEPS